MLGGDYAFLTLHQAARCVLAQEIEMGSVLTIDTGCWFALKLGGAAPAANSIRGGYLSFDEPGAIGVRRFFGTIWIEKVFSKPWVRRVRRPAGRCMPTV